MAGSFPRGSIWSAWCAPHPDPAPLCQQRVTTRQRRVVGGGYAPGVDLTQLAIGVAGGVLVTVLAFVLALRQDHARFAREKRAELYVDLLAEASSELDWLLTQLTQIEMGNVISPKSGRRRASTKPPAALGTDTPHRSRELPHTYAALSRRGREHTHGRSAARCRRG